MTQTNTTNKSGTFNLSRSRQERGLQSKTELAFASRSNQQLARAFRIVILPATIFSTSLAAQTVVQEWPVSQGGNGHVYAVVRFPGGGAGTWYTANSLAVGMEGHLATITSGEENDFVFSLTNTPMFWNQSYGPWLGGLQQPGSPEPGGGWQWVTGEPWSFSLWAGGQPDNFFGEDGLHYYPIGQSTWNDLPADGHHTLVAIAFVVEFDCEITDCTVASDCDCDGNGSHDTCEIAIDSALDCNANGVLDSCDLANGVGFDCNGDTILDECQSCTSAADCCDNDVCTCDQCVAGVCQFLPITYGNINCAGPADQANLDDILCVLAGFSDFASCVNGDLSPPCAGDRTINLDDVLAALQAFSGSEHCNCPR